jgi:hypothetical protein
VNFLYNIFLSFMYIVQYFSICVSTAKNFSTKINMDIEFLYSNNYRLDMQHEYTFTFKNQRLNQQQSVSLSFKLVRSIHDLICIFIDIIMLRESLLWMKMQLSAFFKNKHSILTFTWNDITLSPHNNNFLLIYVY